MTVKEFVYPIQNHVDDINLLSVQFSHQVSFIYFKLLKNTNVLIKTFHKPFTTFASVLYRICKLLPSARVCISYHYNMAAYIVNSTIN
jgi:hypothetical protein